MKFNTDVFFKVFHSFITSVSTLSHKFLRLRALFWSLWCRPLLISVPCCISISGRVLPPASEAATPSTSLWAAESSPTDPSSCGSSGSFTSSAVGHRIQSASPRSDERFCTSDTIKKKNPQNMFNDSVIAFTETSLLKYGKCLFNLT